MTTMPWVVPFSVADVPSASALDPYLESLRGGAAVSTGGSPGVDRFERRLAERFGWEHVVAVSSGTTGLRLVLGALGLSGDILVPGLGFPATFQAATAAGLRLVQCDIEAVNLGMCVDFARRRVDEQTAAVLAVHQFGRPCDARGLAALELERDLVVVFDAAAAVGQRLNGVPVASFGRASVFSFHWSKPLSCMEGGAVVTQDSELAAELRKLRNFGLDGGRPPDLRGENGKLSDVSAALGLVSLDRFDDRFRRRRECHGLYTELLGDVDGLHLLEEPSSGLPPTATVVFEDASAAATVRSMAARGVQCRAYGGQRFRPPRSGPLPVLDRLADRLLSLPLYPSMTEDQVRTVCVSLLGALAHGA